MTRSGHAEKFILELRRGNLLTILNLFLCVWLSLPVAEVITIPVPLAVTLPATMTPGEDEDYV